MRALLIGSGVVAALVLASAAAQAAPVSREEIKVPFTFVVNGEEMPAGVYTVQHDDDQGSALLIRGNHRSVYVLTSPVGEDAAPQDVSLVFQKDGDSGQYHLTQVWDESGEGVAVLDRSK